MDLVGVNGIKLAQARAHWCWMENRASEDDLGGYTIWGRVDKYPGSGYEVLLPSVRANNATQEARDVLQYLQVSFASLFG